MSEFKILRNEQINESLNDSTKQYLLGDLKRPQVLENIFDDTLGIGMLKSKENEVNKAHYHEEIFEYEYVVEGEIALLHLDTMDSVTLKKGDFIVIPPNVKSVQKMKANSQVIFVKSKCIEDKILVDTNEKIREWMKDFNW